MYIINFCKAETPLINKTQVINFISDKLSYKLLNTSEKTYVVLNKNGLDIFYVTNVDNFSKNVAPNYNIIAEIKKCIFLNYPTCCIFSINDSFLSIDFSDMKNILVGKYKDPLNLKRKYFYYALKLINDLTTEQRTDLFGCDGDIFKIAEYHSIDTIIDVIDQYEKNKTDFKIGDIVVPINGGKMFMVSHVDEDSVHGIHLDDGSVTLYKKDLVEKTDVVGTFADLFNQLVSKK